MDFYYLHLLSRLILGVYFILNGLNHFKNLNFLREWVKNKNIPAPTFMVIISGFLLLIGGFSILLGVYIYFGILALTLFFIPTTFLMHDFWNEKEEQSKNLQMINFMKNLALWAALISLIFIPQPWPFSLGN